MLIEGWQAVEINLICWPWYWRQKPVHLLCTIVRKVRHTTAKYPRCTGDIHQDQRAAPCYAMNARTLRRTQRRKVHWFIGGCQVLRAFSVSGSHDRMSSEGGILTNHGNVLLHAPCSQLLNVISKEVIHRDCNGTRES